MILNKFEGAMLFSVLKIANPNGDSNSTENLKVQKIISGIKLRFGSEVAKARLF